MQRVTKRELAQEVVSLLDWSTFWKLMTKYKSILTNPDPYVWVDPWE